jgi:hypothetical protein
MLTPTASQMPMGRTALPLSDEDFLPLRPPQPGVAPPPATAGLINGPGGTPLGAPPPGNGDAGSGSPAVPWQVALQDDGSSVYQIPPITPGGKPIVIAHNKPPKLPPALQPPKQSAP